MALVDLERAGRVTGTETKVRFGIAGAASFCLEALRAVLARDLDAMFNVCNTWVLTNDRLVDIAYVNR